MNERGISFIALLTRIKESEKSEKKELFKKIYDLNRDKVPLIGKNRNIFRYSDKASGKKIYYKYQIKRYLSPLTETTLTVFNRLYLNFLNRETVFPREDIFFLRRLCGSSGSIRDVLAGNYNYLCERLFFRPEKEPYCYRGIGSDCYLSRIFPSGTRRYLASANIFTMRDLRKKTVMLDRFEIINLNRYAEDLERYYLTDIIFESIIDRNDREVMDLYFREGTYVGMCSELGVSVTEARSRVYTVIYKLVRFFDGFTGIRILDLMFSKRDCYLFYDDIREYFPEYGRIMIFLAENGYLYGIEAIPKEEILKLK